MIALFLAALATTHTSQHVPAGLAHNELIGEGCVRTQYAMPGKYSKERIDKDTFLIRGADFEVRCTKWAVIGEVEEVASVTISWTSPSRRENGDILTGAVTYELQINGGDLIALSGTEHVHKGPVSSGRIRAKDSSGLPSEWVEIEE